MKCISMLADTYVSLIFALISYKLH